MEFSTLPILRLAAVLLFLVVLLPATTVLLHAQIDMCMCDKLALRVERDVRCDITFRLTYEESGIEEEVLVKPGGTTNIVCERGLQIFVRECGAHWRKVPEDGCLFNLNAGLERVCCVDVCLTRDNALGCWSVNVRPTISAAITCPCGG